MTVGMNIRALRKRRGLTLDELSALCGVHRDDLGQYERGGMTPRPETVERIARALDAPIAAIREGMAWTAPGPPRAGRPRGTTASSGRGSRRPSGSRGPSPWRSGRCLP